MSAVVDSKRPEDDQRVARPPVSVVVPFAGGRTDAEALVSAFAALELGQDDELIASDNSVDGVLADLDMPAPWRVVAATTEGSPAHARNTGAAAAASDWILFVDSDCRPAADLLDRYFDEPPPADCAMAAGRVVHTERQRSIAARHAATRQMLDQERALAHPFRPYALTANVLVRREAFEQLGGFFEGIFNCEDVDFAWRAHDAGWHLRFVPGAVVEHVDRDSLAALLGQASAQEAASTWVHGRWPHAPQPPVPGLRHLWRVLLGVPGFFLTGQWDRARMKAIDAAVYGARLRGRRKSNRARPRPAPALAGPARRPLQIWCDEYPVLSESFVVQEAAALVGLGHRVEVVAARRPNRPGPRAPGVPVHYLEDDTRRERRRALLRVVMRHPLRSARDRLAHRRWAAQEPVNPLRELAPALVRAESSLDVVLHAHFAAGAALGAMRVARITGRPWTLTAHAYDIYKLPRNLEEKLRSADLVTSGCEYTVRDLRALAGRDESVHEIVMGVDPEVFRRRAPHPAGARVLAVGRLVEKKGFTHLLQAASLEPLRDVLGTLEIIGDGPLRDELGEQAAALGLADRVAFSGAQGPAAVRAALEEAAVLAMPCVVAADGDRDSMPVVVKEAMAMEVPVVVTDEVGLPELVREEFGRIVPPADPQALADALAELLALSAEQRAAMGRAGRAFAEAHANVYTETARLSALFEQIRRR